MAHGLPHTTKLSNQAPGPFGEAVSTRGLREVQQSYTAEGWQGAASAPLRPPCASRAAPETVAMCYLFLLWVRAVNKVAVLWALRRV